MPTDRSAPDNGARSNEVSDAIGNDLAKIADLERALRDPEYFSDPPEACDGCGKSIELERYFGDCDFSEQGAWGYACPACIARLGLQFGWGKGQLYQRIDEPETQWLMVAGFPPSGIAD